MYTPSLFSGVTKNRRGVNISYLWATYATGPMGGGGSLCCAVTLHVALQLAGGLLSGRYSKADIDKEQEGRFWTIGGKWAKM